MLVDHVSSILGGSFDIFINEQILILNALIPLTIVQ